jgi:hypothetical protein
VDRRTPAALRRLQDKELGITPRDLRETLADTVRWLADQGHISLTWAQEAA